MGYLQCDQKVEVAHEENKRCKDCTAGRGQTSAKVALYQSAEADRAQRYHVIWRRPILTIKDEYKFISRSATPWRVHILQTKITRRARFGEGGSREDGVQEDKGHCFFNRLRQRSLLALQR